jgi:segregation and condensation protein B
MDDYQFIDGTRLSSVVEAFIFTSPEPIHARKICDLIEQGEENLELEPEAITNFIEKLNDRYEQDGRSFFIKQIAGGYTFATKSQLSPWLSIFQHEDAYRKLSQSAIETLAIVAYKQPVTKPEVDNIRGVDSGYMLRQLLEKNLVNVSGRLDAPGRPLLYKTTAHFLKHFGMNDIAELPKPREIDEILKDDDMREHRQFLLDRQLELEDMEVNGDEENSDDSLLQAVGKLEDGELVRGKDEIENGQNNGTNSDADE